MINISRESEINLINILIDQDIISGKFKNIEKIRMFFLYNDFFTKSTII